MSVSNNDNNIPNAPGYDLPSPKLVSVGGNIDDDLDYTSNNNNELTSYNSNNHTSHRLSQTKTNDVRSTEFKIIRPNYSEVRNVLEKRVEKMTNLETKTIHTLQVELIAQLIKDYDRLRQDYEILAENFENYEQQHRSTLTPEKLEEYIKIADQVIEMNDLWIRELDKKHETFEISRKSLVNTTINDPGVQVEFDESQEILPTANGDDILEDDVKARSECNGKAFADAIRSVKIDASNYNEKQRGGGGSVSKKIHGQGDITENGHKQVVGDRNKVRSSEENFGIGSSRTDYTTEGINSDTEIGKAVELKNKTKSNVIEKDEKVNGTWDSKSDGNNSQTWSDQVEEYLDENKEKCENIDNNNDQGWEVSHQNDEPNEGEHRYDREAKENKDDLDTRNKKDEHNGEMKEIKHWRNERQGGGNRYRGSGRRDNEWKNGNNRRR